jgi:hypothetical protein
MESGVVALDRVQVDGRREHRSDCRGAASRRLMTIEKERSMQRRIFRGWFCSTATALLVGWGSACAGSAAPVEPPGEADYVPGELVVELVPTLTESAAARRLADLGLVLLGKLADEPPLHLVGVPEGDEAFWAQELVRQGIVVSAEPHRSAEPMLAEQEGSSGATSGHSTWLGRADRATGRPAT